MSINLTRLFMRRHENFSVVTEVGKSPLEELILTEFLL